MTEHIKGIDHLVINVGDIDRAAEMYAMLGFRLTKQGAHAAFGTKNHTFVFDNNYGELLSFSNSQSSNLASPSEPDSNASIGKRAIALATSNAEKACKEIASVGISADGPLSFSRPVELDNSVAEASFHVTFIAPTDTLGVVFFLCQHDTPGLIWRPEWQSHPNSATGISDVTVVIDDPTAVKPTFERLFGEGSVQSRDGNAALNTGSNTIHFVTWDWYSIQYKNVLPERPKTLPSIERMGITVENLETTARCLTDNKVPFSFSSEKTILVPPSSACGILVEFSDAKEG